MSSTFEKPNYFNITIYKGATFKKKIVLKDSLEIPIDLTGYTARSQIRPTPESTEFYDFTTTITSPLLGEIDWVMPADVTTTIVLTPPQNLYSYDLELEGPNGTVYRIIQGYAYISPEVTR